MSFRSKSVEFSEEVFTIWIDVYSHLDVAEVLTEVEICITVMNSQTIEQVDTNNEKNSEAPPSS